MNHAAPLLREAAYARFPRRLLAMLTDGAVLVFSFVVLAMAATAVGSQMLARTALVVLPVSVFLYDPVLVSTTGGTLGHHWMNLRVVADESGRNLPFGRAFLRGMLKGVLGIASFIFMAVTRRHQALHDLATRSTVQVKDISRAALHHYTMERTMEEPAGVSRGRRIAMILAYIVAMFVGMSIIGDAIVSESCLVADVCTPRDELLSLLIVFAWVGASAWFLFQGWRGNLPGARPRAG